MNMIQKLLMAIAELGAPILFSRQSPVAVAYSLDLSSQDTGIREIGSQGPVLLDSPN